MEDFLHCFPPCAFSLDIFRVRINHFNSLLATASELVSSVCLVFASVYKSLPYSLRVDDCCVGEACLGKKERPLGRLESGPWRPALGDVDTLAFTYSLVASHGPLNP